MDYLITLPQVYKPVTQCRCSFQGSKYLGSRIYAFIKGGGKEDFGTWAKFNRGASQKAIKERMDKYNPGRYAALNAQGEQAHAQRERQEGARTPRARAQGRRQVPEPSQDGRDVRAGTHRLGARQEAEG